MPVNNVHILFTIALNCMCIYDFTYLGSSNEVYNHMRSRWKIIFQFIIHVSDGGMIKEHIPTKYLTCLNFEWDDKKKGMCLRRPSAVEWDSAREYACISFQKFQKPNIPIDNAKNWETVLNECFVCVTIHLWGGLADG